MVVSVYYSLYTLFLAKSSFFTHYNYYINTTNKDFFFRCKNLFHWMNFDIFLIFAQNIDRGYTLEPPRRGGSNEYPQSMF